MARIRLVDVKKDFGGVPALRGIDLTVEHGELLAILGPSGCGKSTTMQLLAGFLAPDAGEVWADDRLLSSPRGIVPPERRRMSFVFQSYAVWPHMTVFGNIAFGLQMRKLLKREIAERVHRMLDIVNLAGFEGRYPHELSGGQQQRVALARALVVEPETLLLDEPLSNLDANLREEMRFEVRRLHDEYRYTTVYVTHDQSEAMTTADVIAVMNAGKIEQAGSPEEIYDRPRSDFVARFIGSSNVIKGKVLDDCRLSCAGSLLRCSGGKFVAGRECAAAIRQHVVRLWAEKPAVTENVVPGTVVRQVFLGASRDYLVEMRDGTQLRVQAPAAENIPPGASVWLHLPPERCRALSG